jgi:uncharacterized membrane-anchored protein
MRWITVLLIGLAFVGFGPYLLLGELVLVLGAALGVLYIVYMPVNRYYTRGPDSPTEARIWGYVLVALCVLGAVWLVVRAARAREPVRR